MPQKRALLDVDVDADVDVDVCDVTETCYSDRASCRHARRVSYERDDVTVC